VVAGGCSETSANDASADLSVVQSGRISSVMVQFDAASYLEERLSSIDDLLQEPLSYELPLPKEDRSDSYFQAVTSPKVEHAKPQGSLPATRGRVRRLVIPAGRTLIPCEEQDAVSANEQETAENYNSTSRKSIALGKFYTELEDNSDFIYASEAELIYSMLATEWNCN